MNESIIKLYLLMNPNFSSPRNFVPNYPQNNIPFYNPQKDSHPNLIPQNYPKSPKSANYIPGPMQVNSKSYITKPQYQPIKSNGNNSAYLKSNNQLIPPQEVNNGFTYMYPKVNNQMTKSSFHDHNKFTESTAYSGNTQSRIQTPIQNIRRQPRMSEPAMHQSPFQLNQDTKISFIPTSKKEKELEPSKEEIHFYKKNMGTPQHPKEQKQSNNKEWLRQSAKNKKGQKTLSLDNFDKIKVLGKGKYGEVFLTREKSSGFTVALKVIEKSVIIEQGIEQQFIRQIKIQMFLNHPNIIKLYGCFDDEKNIYLIMQVAIGGQLFHQLKRSQPLPQTKVANIMKQVCSAVDDLHAVRVIHRDLKPENIVMHEGVYKLCDFGWSVHLDNKMRTTFCGTPLYVSPQILKGNNYDEKIDIWSLGIMMYEMLVGQNPFKINKQEQLIKIVKEQISIPSYVYVSKQARDFLDKCLQKNPLDRVTIKELVNHQFFIKNAEKEKNQKKIVL